MHDLQFEARAAEIRGFNLGDDSKLLAHLDARMGNGLRGGEWLLRGVLLYRAGRHPEAVECLDEAVERGHARSLALYLKSCVLREHGSLGEALEALEEARKATSDDGLMSAADLAHARGLLFWRVGNHEDALQWLDQAIEHDEHLAARWLHRGQLLAELGRATQAEQAFERALNEEQDLDLAMYERAALGAGRGSASVTAIWLDRAIRLAPEHRDRAMTDPRFAAVREHPALSELMVSARPPDLRWLDGLASWMPALRCNAQLDKLGVKWLSKARSDRIAATLEFDYEHGPLGTMHTESTLERSRALLSHAVRDRPGPPAPALGRACSSTASCSWIPPAPRTACGWRCR